MSELDTFVRAIAGLCPDNPQQLSVEQARVVVKNINDFLYSNYDGIGTVEALGEQYQYISDFHRYWAAHHREILDIQIIEDSCREVAHALHDVFIRTRGRAFAEMYNTHGLLPEDICRIRLLTANQDFRGSRNFEELSQIFLADNSVFDERVIFEEPEDFVKSIGITGLSQSDKRVHFAKNISGFVIDHNATPFGLIDCYGQDVYELRNALIRTPNAGYGNKKADMFIRDMVVLGVWNNVTGFDQIDVASDVNTIKVALRTGIMRAAIPLVSSFIDIFCYQYGYVDEMNALAWRRVWEIWCEDFPNEAIDSPCLLDYFIYSVVGKQFCKDTLCVFRCNSEGHMFKWHSSRNRNCQICAANHVRNKATLVEKRLPCTDIDGQIAIEKTDFVLSGMAAPNYSECPFKTICEGNGHQNLEPPKSISIKGQTGWETAYTKQGQGGGGLMA
ncbi:MAG TPA: hypothetical protein P5116_05935 [Eubacteriales bacterium]|nr:hypothetical protein [Eubacteriales bacterium]